MVCGAAPHQVQTEVLPCYLMDGAMLFNADDGSIAGNKLREEGLTAEQMATTLAQMGCFVVFASREACDLASPTEGTVRVLLGAEKEVPVPKVRRRRGLLRFFFLPLSRVPSAILYLYIL